MSASPPTPRLFTLRLWQAETSTSPADDPQWRGKVQSLPDGEAYYFADWAALIKHLESMLLAEHQHAPPTPPSKPHEHSG